MEWIMSVTAALYQWHLHGYLLGSRRWAGTESKTTKKSNLCDRLWDESRGGTVTFTDDWCLKWQIHFPDSQLVKPNRTVWLDLAVNITWSIYSLCLSPQRLGTSPSVWSPIRPLWCTLPLCPSMFPSSSLCWFMCKFMWSWGSAENVLTQNQSSGSVSLPTLIWPLHWRWACVTNGSCFHLCAQI